MEEPRRDAPDSEEEEYRPHGRVIMIIGSLVYGFAFTMLLLVTVYQWGFFRPEKPLTLLLALVLCTVLLAAAFYCFFVGKGTRTDGEPRGGPESRN